MKFLFVGEKRSPKARQMKVTWQDGKLAAKTLRQALLFAGVELSNCTFTNILQEKLDVNIISPSRVRYIRERYKAGQIIVGMGKIVANHLNKLNINHIPIVHPAARGKIRKTELYNAHVKEALCGK